MRSLSKIHSVPYLRAIEILPRQLSNRTSYNAPETIFFMQSLPASPSVPSRVIQRIALLNELYAAFETNVGPSYPYCCRRVCLGFLLPQVRNFLSRVLAVLVTRLLLKSPSPYSRILRLPDSDSPGPTRDDPDGAVASFAIQRSSVCPATKYRRCIRSVQPWYGVVNGEQSSESYKPIRRMARSQE